MIKLVEIPELILEPMLLAKITVPSALNISMARLQTVVLPLVPVTPIIFFGLFTYFKNLGQIFRATTPGKFVPFLFVIFNAMMDIMDRLYGKPRISAEVAHTGGISLNIATDAETKEMIEGGLG